MNPVESTLRDPNERYRLYIDESGDHAYGELDTEAHRFLCLLGCWFKTEKYRTFPPALAAFKQRHVPHNPDDPVVLHREDIVNRRGPYWRLRDPERRAAFDEDLIDLVRNTDFTIVAIVIDKKAQRERFTDPAHPYHLAIGFMLQRYCGYLNHINRRGDVMAESRGGKENRLLGASYEWHYERGVWTYTPAEAIQRALTTGKLKIKQKSANVAGLQLADILSHPVRKSILIELGYVAGTLSPFAVRLLDAVDRKFNHHLYDDRVWGYGKVVYPRLK